METHNKKSFKVKLNPHITIYPVEEKMYTKEEVKRIASKAFTVKSNNDTLIDDFERWFEQNVK